MARKTALDLKREPYIFYEDEACQLWHGDALAVLPMLKAQKVEVDLIVTDPPYGIGYQSNARTEKMRRIHGDDGSVDVAAVVEAALTVLKGNRHIYMFGRFDVSALRLSDPAELIWDKGSPAKGDLSSKWGIAHEPILFSTFVPSRANKVRGDGRLAARLRSGSVLRVPRLNSRQVSRHPTEKPVAILRQMIESSSLLGETVLDPFAGSCSTLHAAKLEGRKAIGIEIDLNYCEEGAKRLKEVSFNE